MTTREKWFLAGLILLGFLLPGSLVWQSARYGDAEVALRRVLALEDAAAADPGQAALNKEARPRIRQALDRGDPEDAFQRIAVLAQVDGTKPKDEKPDQPIPLDQLWPPNSPERAKAQQVLKDFVAKQQAGHELAMARERLVQVADAVRTGNRDEALRLFGEASELVKNAPVRPGFEKKDQTAGGTPPPPQGASLPPGEYEARLGPILRFFQGMLAIQNAPPQALERMPAEQRANLERMLPLAIEIQKAAAEGKDLTALILLQPRFQQAKSPEDTQRVLNEALAAVRAAPMRPKPRPGAPPTPQPVPQPAVAPPSTPPGTPPPTLPPTQAPPPSQKDVEQLLIGFDQMRKIPDADYQRIRPQLAQMVSGLLMRAAAATQAASNQPLIGVGGGNSLRLELTPTGALSRVLMGADDLAAGLKPGGVVVMANGGGTLKLEGQVKQRKGGLVQTVSSEGGRVFTEYVPEGDSLLVRVKAKREKEGKPADLVLDLPFRAAGWRWDTGGEPQTVRADDSLFWVPVAGMDPKPVTLRKGERGLVFQPGPGSSLSYSENRLLLRAPLPTAVGPTEMTLRISPAPEGK